LDWVLTKQRGEDLQRQLTQLNTEALRRILMEAGLCVVQGGREYAALKQIETRLEEDEGAKQFLANARQRLTDPINDPQNNHHPLKNALAVFYLKPGQDSGSVEFVHKSFGEFLCAERLQMALEDRTEPGSQQQRQPFCWQIYDLLGGWSLTPEIVGYLMALLKQSPAFEPIKLFERLNDFYDRWCQGEFIDQPQDKNLPQQKMLQLRSDKIETDLGLRQVDVTTGLNVMILLLELHRYGQTEKTLKDQMTFYPSGKPPADRSSTTRLLEAIGHSYCLGTNAFTLVVGPFLHNSYLSSADLSSADLSSANLSSANLSSADLRSVNLRSANLSSANLSSANLIYADLSSADLISANLISANLSRANFSRADLSSAILSDRSGCIQWDEYTNWQGVRGLETAVGVPEELKKQLGLG
jgi:hypothetical protein